MADSTQYARYNGLSSSSTGVTSLNGETGAITLVGGTGITITPSGQNITISSTSAGDVTIGPFGSTPNANGLSINGSQVLNMQPADATHPGGVSITTQSFLGNKTFLGTVTASTPGVGSAVLNGSGAGAGGGITLNGASGQSYTWESDGVSIILYNNVTGVIETAKPGNFVFNDSSQVPMLTLDQTAGFLAVKPLTLGTNASIAGSLLIANGGVLGTSITIQNLGNTTAYNFNLPTTAGSAGQVLTSQGGASTSMTWTTPTTGTVTAVSVATANGFAGTSSGGATPALTLTTTVTGILQGNGTAISAATTGNLTDAGTDGIVVTGGTGAVLGSGTSIAQTKADGSHNGYLSSTDWTTFNGKGSGTVTSVALSVPATSILGVTGSPVTTSGTLGLTTTGTSGGIPYFSSTSALSSSALLTANGVVYGGGAGTTPASTAAGTTGQVLVATTGAAPSWGTVPATAMPALTGDVTTSAGSVATTAAATQANIVTLSKSTGVAVHGTNTNDSASAGYVGEFVQSQITSLTNFPTSTQYGDLTSISLTAGDWDVSANMEASANGATVVNWILGISTTAGNDSTGLNFGDNAAFLAAITGISTITGAIPDYRISIASTTTVYMKYNSNYSVATPQARGRISARRRR